MLGAGGEGNLVMDLVEQSHEGGVEIFLTANATKTSISFRSMDHMG